MASQNGAADERTERKERNVLRIDVELVTVKLEACATTTPATAIIAAIVERMCGIFMLLLLAWQY